MITVNKFGGEIMGNQNLVEMALFRIKEQLKRKEKPIVVVSALVGVTNKLEELFKTRSPQKLLKELDKQHKDWMINQKIDTAALKTKIENLKLELKKDLKKQNSLRRENYDLARRDKILAYGEKWSSLLFTEFLILNDIKAKRFTAEELGVITDDNFSNANIFYEESEKNIKAKLKNFSFVPVITGFIGKTKKGKTTTLGRGGSDTTACLLGAVFSPSSKVILWKNVAGVLSADPKIVENPKRVKFLSYQEAEEAGKVIHSKAMSFVKRMGVKVEVVYILNPKLKTIIGKKATKQPLKSERPEAKIISFKEHLYLFKISSEKILYHGALFEITKIISQEKNNIVLIRNTKNKLYIVLEKSSHNLSYCQKEIEALGYEVESKEVAMVNVVGRLNERFIEKFNRLLYQLCPRAELGAFPYKNCLRIEGIIEKTKVNELIKKFHKKLII